MRPRRARAALALLAALAATTSLPARADPPPAPPAPATFPRHVGVVDRDGLPFRGAEVVEVPLDANDLPVLTDDAKVLGTTDADGVLSPVPAPSSPGVRLAVRGREAAAVLLPRTTDPVLVRLVAASPIRGWVRNADGGAPKGAVVEARRLGGGEWGFRTTVDDTGRYAFESLVGDPYRLRVRRPDGAWQSLGTATGPAEVPQAVLSRGALVTAVVRDMDAAKRGTGCLGLSIRLVRVGTTASGEGPAGEDSAVEGTCADDGAIQFVEVSSGVYEAFLADPARIWEGAPHRVEVDGPRAVPAGTWWVRRRGAIAGTVVDADRKPVAGALVRAAPPAGAVPPQGGFGGGQPVTTGADGAFRLERLAPAEGWRLVASLAGKSPAVAAPLSVSAARTTDAGRIRLEAPWRLRVAVRDPEGRAVADARVVATPAGRPAADENDPVARALMRRAATDAAGVATLDDLPDGATRVRVARRGFVDTDVGVTGPAGRREASVDVVLAVAARLRGRVTAGPGAPPPESVVVRARVRATGEDRTVEPDADGRFTVDDLPPGPIDVEAVRRGASPDLVLARVEGALPGLRDELVLSLVPTYLVAGRVSGPAIRGDDPPRVRLEVLRPDADRARDVRVVAAEAVAVLERGDWRFSFPGVPPGPYALRAVLGRLDGGAVPIHVEGADATGVELTLPSGATISGRVRDARGGTAALGAVVALVRLEGGAFAPVPVAERPTLVAAADGWFSFEGVAPGLWRVEATDEGAAPASAVLRVAEGERASVPMLVLTRGGSVEGRLVDVRGRPLAGVPVRVWRRPQLEEARGAVSAEDGAFRVAPLEAGRYRVRVEDRAGAAASVEAEVEVVEGETTVVELSPTGRALIVGTLRRHGTPVGGATVEVASDDACGCDRVVRRAASDAFGRFTFDGLPAGLYVVRALDGTVLGQGSIRLRGAERVDRDFELGEARLEGVVRTSGGRPVRDAEVVAYPRAAEEDAVGRARTGPDGTFSISGIGVGVYRVEVTPRGRPTRVVEGVLADLPGARTPLEVVLGRGGSVDLLVRDEGRRGVGGAEVWVESPAGDALHTRPFFTAPSGRVLVDGLPDGPVRVRVRARGLGRPRPVSAFVREGTVVPVEVTLPSAGVLRLTVTSGRDPVARARVDLLRMPEADPIESRRTLRRGDERNNAFGSTARTGTLVVDDLADGDYLAVVTAGSDWQEARVPVRVRRDAVVDLRVVLLPRPR